MPRLTAALREGFGAVVSSLENHRFTPPRSSCPADADFAPLRETAPWAVAAIPTAEPPVITADEGGGLLSVGRLRRSGQPDMVVLIKEPRVPQPELLLEMILRNLEALLERSVLLEGLDA